MPAGDLEQSRPRSRCSHSGARLPGWPRGSSRARAAFCRKRRANRALSASSSRISSSTFSGVRPSNRSSTGSSVSVRRIEDAVVVVQALRPIAEPLPQRALQGQPQRQVQPAAERAEEDHLPVAELIARRLDEERAIGRQAAGGERAAGGRDSAGCAAACVEEVLALAASRGSRAASSRSASSRRKPADGQAQVVAAAAALAAPERHHGRRALGRHDEHAVGLDPLQPPGVGAQQERVADAALVDELLVQLADADAAGGVGGILPGVGDGAAADQGQLLAAGQGLQAVVDAVPADARLQGRQLPRRREPSARSPRPSAAAKRIAAADHFQHRFERLRRQVAEGIGPADQAIQRPARPSPPSPPWRRPAGPARRGS